MLPPVPNLPGGHCLPTGSGRASPCPPQYPGAIGPVQLGEVLPPAPYRPASQRLSAGVAETSPKSDQCPAFTGPRHCEDVAPPVLYLPGAQTCPAGLGVDSPVDPQNPAAIGPSQVLDELVPAAYLPAGQSPEGYPQHVAQQQTQLQGEPHDLNEYRPALLLGCTQSASHNVATTTSICHANRHVLLQLCQYRSFQSPSEQSSAKHNATLLITGRECSILRRIRLLLPDSTAQSHAHKQALENVALRFNGQISTDCTRNEHVRHRRSMKSLVLWLI